MLSVVLMLYTINQSSRFGNVKDSFQAIVNICKHWRYYTHSQQNTINVFAPLHMMYVKRNVMTCDIKSSTTNVL